MTQLDDGIIEVMANKPVPTHPPTYKELRAVAWALRGETIEKHLMYRNVIPLTEHWLLPPGKTLESIIEAGHDKVAWYERTANSRQGFYPTLARAWEDDRMNAADGTLVQRELRTFMISSFDKSFKIVPKENGYTKVEEVKDGVFVARLDPLDGPVGLLVVDALDGDPTRDLGASSFREFWVLDYDGVAALPLSSGIELQRKTTGGTVSALIDELKSESPSWAAIKAVADSLLMDLYAPGDPVITAYGVCFDGAFGEETTPKPPEPE